VAVGRGEDGEFMIPVPGFLGLWVERVAGDCQSGRIGGTAAGLRNAACVWGGVSEELGEVFCRVFFNEG
jgi:hypothetical protein